LQQILKATTAGEETFTEKELIMSIREDFKDGTNSSLQDYLPHFNHRVVEQLAPKEASGRFNLANLRLDVIKKANISEGGCPAGGGISGPRGVGDNSTCDDKPNNIVSLRSALSNIEIPSMRERLLGKIKQSAVVYSVGATAGGAPLSTEATK
jgi:hypothetical protein